MQAAAAVVTQLDLATKRHYMPVVTNQIWLYSPILHRIFKPAKEGSWGLALPSFSGRSIVEPIEIASASGGAGAYKDDDTSDQTPFQPSRSAAGIAGANYDWKMYW